MARILVTGSTTGLGLAAALEMIAGGHEVIVHARTRDRASTLPPAAGVVIGDLGEPDQVHAIVDQLHSDGPLDGVIHNAGIDGTRHRTVNSLGQPLVLAVNLYAPYLLTALIERPARLIYVSSDMHTGGRADLDDIEWATRPWNGTQAYSDSKPFVTRLAFAVARRRPDVCSNAVDPGWVPTRMGGPAATDDLVLGHRTQTWLATSDLPDAATNRRYWYHQQPQPAATAAADEAFQDQLLQRLEQHTGIALH